MGLRNIVEGERRRHPQGPCWTPSPGVLCLTDTERAHLANLVRPGRSGQQPTARFSPSVRQLLDLMHEVPAVVLGRRMELLACNDAAQAVVFGAQLARRGTSAARAFFLDPRARSQHLSWDSVAADIVAQLRLEAGRHPDDAKLASLVGELELTYQILQLPDRPEQSIATYSYALGTPTQERMRLLLSWHAPASEARRPSDTSGTTTLPDQGWCSQTHGSVGPPTARTGGRASAQAPWAGTSGSAPQVPACRSASPRSCSPTRA